MYVFSQVVSGTIIDNLGSLRDLRSRIADDLSEKCFIWYGRPPVLVSRTLAALSGDRDISREELSFLLCKHVSATIFLRLCFACLMSQLDRPSRVPRHQGEWL
jgi:hypothetical protein